MFRTSILLVGTAPVGSPAASVSDMGIDRAELIRHHGRGMTDLLDDRCRLLLVGINPGLWSAAVDAPFARPGNRFWPALHRAGILPRVVDAGNGLSEADRQMVLSRGLGVTNLVDRATARADELDPAELREGVISLREKVARIRPSVVAVCGITAYRSAFAEPRARRGRQRGRLGDRPLWVVPNPSGLNAHESVDSLARAYAEPAAAAGLL